MQLRVVLRQLNAGLRTSRSEREGYVFFRGGNRARMELDKQFVLEELQKSAQTRIGHRGHVRDGWRGVAAREKSGCSSTCSIWLAAHSRI